MMYVIAGIFTLFMILVFGLVFNPPTKWAHKMTGDDKASELEDDVAKKKAP
jgi:hypothetical protein